VHWRQTNLGWSQLGASGSEEAAQFSRTSADGGIGHTFSMAVRVATYQESLGALPHPGTAGPSSIRAG
jgi:hypothetical protein